MKKTMAKKTNYLEGVFYDVGEAGILRCKDTGGDDNARPRYEGPALRYGWRAKRGSYVEVKFGDGSLKFRKDRNMRLLYGHDRNRHLGHTGMEGTNFKLVSTGLDVEFELPNTAEGRNAEEEIEQGVVTGLSVGVDIINSDYKIVRRNGERILMHIIEEAILREVSLVGEPAFNEARLKKLSEDFNLALQQDMQQRLNLATSKMIWIRQQSRIMGNI